MSNPSTAIQALALVGSGSDAIDYRRIAETINQLIKKIQGENDSPTVAVSGFSTLSNATIYWARFDDLVIVWLPVISGTSNSPVFVVDIPLEIQPARGGFVSVPQGLSSDNSVNITDCSLLVNINQFQFYHNFSATGWTASGLKASGGFFFSYLLN